ncbi:MAG: helicase-related protein [Patescibacteria group bacterium]|nr:helicase-related protein [Patescibacteria group bacterium]
MELSRTAINNVLIVSFIPYFLERGNFWFEENLDKILKARKTQMFWQDNTLFLKRGQKINFSEFLRKLDEMGYEKVFRVGEPGEFSQRGGIVDVFPVNTNFALRFEFLGNQIENIEKLDIEIENEQKQKELLKRKLKSQKLFSDLKGLKPKDYLVHLDHGIGRFLKITKFQVSSFKFQEYYLLEYAQGDKLYVPIGLERKLSRYIGFLEPKLSRLGSSLWQRTKRKIKEETEKFARELLSIFAKKEIAQRIPYQEKEISKILDSTFEYPLTADQIEALRDIEKDLKKEKPMDRLLCGDVGFGKTELALRAAARVSENGKQVVLICPTTILASQHFETFKKRLEGLPFKVEFLSRLQPKKIQKKILKELSEGKIDILIGTHRVLSKDINFQDLGLLIIDDEQKFGVRQKEKLRKLKPEIDILSLSATPIPRTLYMALSSLKDVSLIQTPPEGRKTVQTYILPFRKEIIKKVIEKEIRREGQIYFLHNRVETILAFKKFLENLETGARIEILHGRLKESEIAKIMENFQKGKFNLLLTTTIIENGLDLPKVNTLIVDNATKLGLSQAYQIRGRIGRSYLQSFAYFLYPKRKLSGLAKKRLRALKEAEELGSSYKIALKDLEIRGAGNILGKEQSGNINRVGLNLYCQMLSEAIEKLKKL